MALAPTQLSTTSDAADRRVIRSSVPVLLSRAISADKETVVIADHVIVDGPLKTSGNNLIISCRELVFADGSSIDTSGSDGLPSFVPEMRPVADPEQTINGSDGKSGGNGQSAGNVEITAFELLGHVVIEAVGGAGGRAQDGGHGLKGSRGKDGVFSYTSDIDKTPPQCIGGDGGQGGAAGIPGFRGKPGNGGHIAIRYVSGEQLPIDGVRVDGGRPGGAGVRGDLGPGGDPGQGGLIREDDPMYDRGYGGEGPGGGGGFYAFANRDLKLREFFVLHDSTRKDSSTDALPPEHDLPAKLHQTYAGLLAKSFVSILSRPPLDDNSDGEERHGPDGHGGPPGASRDAELPDRLAEPLSVSGDIQVLQIGLDQYSDVFDDVAIDFLTFALEDEFRTSDTPSETLYRKLRSLLGIAGGGTSRSDRKKSSFAIALSINQKLNLGLDYYGFRPEQAPLISFTTYSELIDRAVIPNTDRIEQSFNTYWAKFNSKEELISSITLSSSASRGALTALKLESDRITSESLALIADVPGLQARVEAVQTLLMYREAELTAAIQRDNAKCDLTKTIAAAFKLVGAVGSGGAGLIGAAAAAGEFYADFASENESFDKIWEIRNFLSKDLKRVGENAKTVADSIEAVRAAVDSIKGEDKPLPQFTMERKQIDEIAAKYSSLTEAGAYRETAYEFLASVEARNSAILNYNALLTQYIELQVKTTDCGKAIDALNGALSGLYDPAEPVIMLSINRIYHNALSIAAQMVHSERKALAYHFGVHASAPVSALNLASVIDAHQMTSIRDWSAAKERFRAKRVLSPGLLAIEISLLVMTEAWASFKKFGLLSFVIRRDHPRYAPIFEALPGLRITGLGIELNGARAAHGQDQLPWSMVHAGAETIYDADGNSTNFTHRTVKFTGFTPLSGGASIISSDFSENNLYAGVSPFASWLLAYSMNPALQLDLSGLSSATLKLTGYIVEG